MKVCLVLLALVNLAVSHVAISSKPMKFADKQFLEKQKFLLEIVYRVEDPLMFDKYIKYGENFSFDKSHYTTFDFYMEKFYESYKSGALLPKGEFFGALVKTHHKQAWGLFNFFYYVKNFETFMQNVCWARMHVNEGMFVYALTLAVIHRDDFEGLMLPTIYEIFPQYFFNSKFIYQAEKFDYDVWSKLIMYEKEYSDVLYKDFSDLDENLHFYFYTKDWKTWQWWKMMGLGEHWYPESKFMMRENTQKYNMDSKYLDIISNVKMFWMPVDYTRDVQIFNDHSQLSYFTEDLGWNAYWYYLNMDYAFFLDGKKFEVAKDRRGEYWISTVQQLIARYYVERLSHGFGDIPEFAAYADIEYGYNSELISYNGQRFSVRPNYFDHKTFGNFAFMDHFNDFGKRIYGILDRGYFKTADGQTIDLRDPKSVKYIGDMLQGNLDMFDKYFFNYFYLFSHMYFSELEQYDFEVSPNVFLNFETMLRDPFFYVFYKKFIDIFYQFKYHLKPYTHEELFYPGVIIKDVKIDELVTYFDLVDFDVTTLLNDKMIFDNDKFVWDKTLLARQARLNHKPFHLDFSIQSDKVNKVVIRTFYAPKFDEFERIISLTENRENFIEIDEFVYTLNAGMNSFKRNSKDFYWTIEDRTTYTELYKYVMLAYEGKYELPLDASEPHCGFPDRLLLPHGWASGFPVQFFFMVTPYDVDYEQFATYDHKYTCGIGSGVRHIDELPFGYPFDRPIDEYSFYVSNMLFKDVKVYHEEKFEKYFTKKFEHFGTFDYSSH